MCSTSFSGSLFSTSWTRLPCALFLPVSICLASWCASLFSLTFSSRLVCFLVEFWTLLPCLFYFFLVHDHNRLGFGMLTLETAVFAFVDLVPAATEKVSLIRSNIVWNRWKSTLRAGSIKSEPEPRNGNVNTVYFNNQARGNSRISRTEFVYDEREHAMANF